MNEADRPAWPVSSTRTRIALRAATSDDLPFLLALRQLTMTEHLQRAGEPVDEATHLQRAQSNFADACIICESEGEEQSEPRIGLLKLSRAPDAWYVHQLQILPAWQSQGIGMQVMQDVLDQASRSKVPVSLSVLHGNPARRLYERLGFRPSGETANQVVLTWRP